MRLELDWSGGLGFVESGSILFVNDAIGEIARQLTQIKLGQPLWLVQRNT